MNRQRKIRAISRNISNRINGVSRTVGMMGSKADKLRQQAERKLGEAKKTFTNAESRIRKYVNTNPEKALMIAAGVGVAIGAIMATFLRPNKAARK